MIYPTVMAFIAKRYPGGSDTAITFTVTMMGLGSVIGNYIIGFVIEAVKKMYGERMTRTHCCAGYRRDMDLLVCVRCCVRYAASFCTAS